MLLVRLLVVVLVAFFCGCATAPMYRPVSPPLGQHSFEAGGAVHGIVGTDIGGVGASAWMQGELAKDINIVARGQFTDLFPYRGSRGVFRDVQFGGAGGLRGLYNINEDLTLGGEVLIDVLQENLTSVNGTSKTFINLIGGFPIAERALPNLWIYVEPQIGAGYRFGDDVPFAGIMEIPLGVSWQPADWALVVVEGGFSIPYNAGYLGIGGAFRL